MALTTLDEMTALIVIDLQKGIVSYPTAHPIDEVVKHAGALAEAFRSHGLPVVLVTVEGAVAGRTEQPRRNTQPLADWAELVVELNRQPGDHVVVKRRWGAFTGTDLDEYLRKLAVTQVVIAGFATSIGVESTARHAHEHGFHVTLALDAMTDVHPDAHLHSVTRIFPRLGETGTTREIIELLHSTRA